MKKEKLKQIEEKINHIDDRLTELFNGMEHKAKECDYLKKHLKNIKLKVDKIALALDNDGCVSVSLSYTPSFVQLKIDNECNVEYNPLFVAINSLDLISLEDMQRINAYINKAKSMAKKG